MDWLRFFLQANAVLSGLFVLSIATKIFFIWKFFKRETFAIMIDNDRTTKKVIKVDQRRESFTYDKGEYVIEKPYIQYGNKRFLLYIIGVTDAVSIVKGADSVIHADVLHSIMENKALKDMNTPPSLFDRLDKKTIMMIVGGAIAVYLVFQYFG